MAGVVWHRALLDPRLIAHADRRTACAGFHRELAERGRIVGLRAHQAEDQFVVRFVKAWRIDHV